MPPPEEPQRTITEGTITEAIGRVVAEVEQLTGLRSRWNGSVITLGAATAAVLAREPFFARKDWSCAITVLDPVTTVPGRWRTLIHEALHSVSAGLTAQSYTQFSLWEEAVVENLQRLYRPAILRSLGVDAPEALFQAEEGNWRFNTALEAMLQIGAALAETGMSQTEFLERLLRTPLADRKATALLWGRQTADFARFKRVYAEASGHLR